MKLSKKIFFIFFYLMLIVTFHSTITIADTENQDFSLEIIPPENQFNTDVSYFDILVEPGQKQTLDVFVANTGKINKKIQVTPTNAITNENGIIDYSKQNEDYIFDKTLEYPFTNLTSSAQTVEVKPGESKRISFDFEAPKNSFDGIILGGFVADLVDDDTKVDTQGITFINKFQYVKAVIVRSNDQKITPEITLNEVKPALHNYRTAVVANLQNTTPLLLGKVNISADIRKDGSNTIIKSEKRQDVDFAPNSNFDFPIMWDNEPLEPGNYVLDMEIIAEETTFIFSEDFKISKSTSNILNSEAYDLDNSDFSLLWILLIIGISILIITLAFVIFAQKKKSNTLIRGIKIERNKSIKKFIKENKRG